jgi:hypothetical protein
VLTERRDACVSTRLPLPRQPTAVMPGYENSCRAHLGRWLEGTVNLLRRANAVPPFKAELGKTWRF